MEVVENAPWGCYEAAGAVHVAPMMDLLDHELDEDCACGPTPECLTGRDGQDSWMFTHHSLDGREASE
jgi:hypothetical protein